MWREILIDEIEKKGIKEVAHELGVSTSMLTLIKAEKYPNTERIAKRVGRIYGNGGIDCPVLGHINPAVCAEKWNLAKKIGMKAGNPETLRLYKSCLNCSLRGR